MAKKSKTVPIPTIIEYIKVYASRLYPIWPVLDSDALSNRLGNSDDIEALILALALFAATYSCP